MIYSLFTDGGSRGNPGPAAIGGRILDSDSNEICVFSESIGVSTNNIAEYSALIKGLNMALKYNISSITCYLDSELVVKQLNGIYKVKDPNMKILSDQVNLIVKKFQKVQIRHILRNENKIADKLVNEALDRAGF